MGAIDAVTLGVADPEAASRFTEDAFGLGDRVRVRTDDEATAGFRGFTMSLVVAQPADVDTLVDRARAAGATVLKPAKKSLWGYGGAVQAPDGTIWTLASSSKKNTGPATGEVEDLVLQLGVTDPAASKQFYVDRGFEVAKSYGKKYVELATGPVTLTLNRRADVAKTAGVSPDGSGSHRLTILGDSGAFTDPDGFAWESSTG